MKCHENKTKSQGPIPETDQEVVFVIFLGWPVAPYPATLDPPLHSVRFPFSEPKQEQSAVRCNLLRIIHVICSQIRF